MDKIGILRCRVIQMLSIKVPLLGTAKINFFRLFVQNMASSDGVGKHGTVIAKLCKSNPIYIARHVYVFIRFILVGVQLMQVNKICMSFWLRK